RLKEAKESKASRKELSIPKEGDAQICILGLTQSGKSSLLAKLTNARPEISIHPFTTQRPEIGTMDYGGARLQMIEIPSTFHQSFMNTVHGSDAVLAICKKEDRKELEKIIERFKIRKPIIWVDEEKIETIKERLWKSLGLMRVYTKDVGKKPESKALVMKKD